MWRVILGDGERCDTGRRLGCVYSRGISRLGYSISGPTTDDNHQRKPQPSTAPCLGRHCQSSLPHKLSIRHNRGFPLVCPRRRAQKLERFTNCASDGSDGDNHAVRVPPTSYILAPRHRISAPSFHLVRWPPSRLIPRCHCPRAELQPALEFQNDEPR